MSIHHYDGDDDVTKRAHEVDYKEVTRKFIVGSPAIDQMRKEIDSVVNGVIGLVVIAERRMYWQDLFRRSIYENFISSKCEWRISAVKKDDQWMNWHVECWSWVKRDKIYSMGMDSVFNSYKNLQEVHGYLPVFVEGMAKTFPFLIDSWQPILDAADYFEKRRPIATDRRSQNPSTPPGLF